MDESSWPAQKAQVVSPMLAMEITTEAAPARLGTARLLNEERFSDWMTLLRVTELSLDFLRKCRSSLRLPTARVYWCKQVQSEHFPLIRSLLSGKESKPKTDPSLKMINDLNLYMDSEGLIRSRGRINNIISYGQDPILLSGHAHAVKLYIRHVHENSLHAGVSQTIAALRRQVWIPKIRPVVKNVVSACYTCKRLTGPMLIQPGPPDLPKERVTFTRPFLNVGVDYSGAIHIKDGDDDNVTRKIYICLFTCMASRAVHLEVAYDNSAHCFLLLFRRFVSRWGLPASVTSDNAANFHNVADFLTSYAEDPEVIDYFTQNNLRWHFIHPRSPWEGGFYERLIGVVKNCLRLSMYRQSFTYDEMVTMLQEVMARVNNRPLTYIGNSIEDLEPLTPNHLLVGHPIDVLPPLTEEEEDDPSFEEGRQPLVAAFRHRSGCVRKFVRVWEQQYLRALRARHYNRANAQNVGVKVGDVVLVETDNERSKWPLGRVTNLNEDGEGIVRSAVVFIRGHLRTFTLNKLVLLEVDESSKDGVVSLSDPHRILWRSTRAVAAEHPNSEQSTEDIPTEGEVEKVRDEISPPLNIGGRTRRGAAVAAAKKILEQSKADRSR